MMWVNRPNDDILNPIIPKELKILRHGKTVLIEEVSVSASNQTSCVSDRARNLSWRPESTGEGGVCFRETSFEDSLRGGRVELPSLAYHDSQRRAYED